MVVATSLIVAITNGGINKITKMMGAFDKHTSMDKLEVPYSIINYSTVQFTTLYYLSAVHFSSVH